MRRWLRGIVCLLVMSVVLFAGCSSIQQTGAAQDQPEVRNNGTAIQWKYGSESEWRDLVALADLMGAAGEKGAAGIAGKDGVDGKDGIDGQNGKDGSCPGYFYAEGSVSAWPLQYGSQKISLSEVINKGGLIAATQDGGVTLKKGHTYRVIISGSLGVCSGASDGSGYYGIQLTDSSATPDFCREITRIKRDGVSAAIPYSTDYHSFHFTRLYDASAQDITLKFLFEQSEYDTYIECFLGTITITALD